MAHQACTPHTQLSASAHTLAAGSKWHCVSHKFPITWPDLKFQFLQLRWTRSTRTPQWIIGMSHLTPFSWYHIILLFLDCKTCVHSFKGYIKSKEICSFGLLFLLRFIDSVFYSSNQGHFNYLCSENLLNYNRPCMNDNVVSYLWKMYDNVMFVIISVTEVTIRRETNQCLHEGCWCTSGLWNKPSVVVQRRKWLLQE